MAKSKKKRRIKKKSKIFELQRFEHLNWNFQPIPTPFPGEHGLPNKHYENTGDTDPESICGGIDDSQDVELYDGSLGVPIGFVQNHERPVGQIHWNDNLTNIYDSDGNVNDIRWATGTLISRDLFLTAGHNFDNHDRSGWVLPKQNGSTQPLTPNEVSTNMHVNFNYQRIADNSILPEDREERFPILRLVEYRLGNLDFAIVRLGGNPGDTYGFAQISNLDADLADMLCIIQHPAGVPKRIDAGPLFHFHDDRLGYDSIDTLGGTSGSGILRESTGLIVGVHTNGGCSPDAGSHNHGVRITSIINNSPTIQQILQNSVTNPILDIRPPIGTIIETNPSADIGTSPVFDRDVTSPFLDSPQTNPAVDFRKTPFLDKPPMSDVRPDLPFVLSTPHHFNQNPSTNDVNLLKSAYEQIFEKAKLKMDKQGLSQEEITYVNKLYQQYQNLG